MITRIHSIIGLPLVAALTILTDILALILTARRSQVT